MASAKSFFSEDPGCGVRQPVGDQWSPGSANDMPKSEASGTPYAPHSVSMLQALWLWRHSYGCVSASLQSRFYTGLVWPCTRLQTQLPCQQVRGWAPLEALPLRFQTRDGLYDLCRWRSKPYHLSAATPYWQVLPTRPSPKPSRHRICNGSYVISYRRSATFLGEGKSTFSCLIPICTSVCSKPAVGAQDHDACCCRGCSPPSPSAVLYGRGHESPQDTSRSLSITFWRPTMSPGIFPMQHSSLQRLAVLGRVDSRERCLWLQVQVHTTLGSPR